MFLLFDHNISSLTKQPKIQRYIESMYSLSHGMKENVECKKPKRGKNIFSKHCGLHKQVLALKQEKKLTEKRRKIFKTKSKK
jgi:hypothetical protein